MRNIHPFINGTAVYKARALYASIDPLMNYNELDLCSEGVFKNGNSRTALEIDPAQLQLINKDNFSIYPNPASTQLTIDYSLFEAQKGSLILSDVTGRETLNIELNAEANKLVVNVSAFPKGVYLYRYIVNGHTSQTGKLIIQ